MDKFYNTIGRIIGILIVAVLVMYLWNGILPGLFGFKQITYLQTLGLYVICSFFFKKINVDSDNKA